MQGHALVERYMQYHLWAQERVYALLEAMDPAPEEAVRLFGHICAADLTWQARIAGGKAPRNLFGAEMTLLEVREHLDRLQETWPALLEATSEEGLERGVRYANTKGVRYTTPLIDILMHVFNHGTYHRAQIARIVRQAGGEPVNTDFIGFARERDPL